MSNVNKIVLIIMRHLLIICASFQLYLAPFICIHHSGGFIIFCKSFLVSGDFCRLLITFANSLYPGQYRQNVRPDLDTDRLPLWKWSWKFLFRVFFFFFFFLEKANFEKSQQVTESFEITQRAELFTRELIEITHGATCAFCALRYVRFISKYPYEKRRTNKMKKDNLKMCWYGIRTHIFIS